MYSKFFFHLTHLRLIVCSWTLAYFFIYVGHWSVLGCLILFLYFSCVLMDFAMKNMYLWNCCYCHPVFWCYLFLLLTCSNVSFNAMVFSWLFPRVLCSSCQVALFIDHLDTLASINFHKYYIHSMVEKHSWLELGWKLNVWV